MWLQYARRHTRRLKWQVNVHAHPRCAKIESESESYNGRILAGVKMG